MQCARTAIKTQKTADGKVTTDRQDRWEEGREGQVGSSQMGPAQPKLPSACSTRR